MGYSSSSSSSSSSDSEDQREKKRRKSSEKKEIKKRVRFDRPEMLLARPSPTDCRILLSHPPPPHQQPHDVTRSINLMMLSRKRTRRKRRKKRGRSTRSTRSTRRTRTRTRTKLPLRRQHRWQCRRENPYSTSRYLAYSSMLPQRRDHSRWRRRRCGRPRMRRERHRQRGGAWSQCQKQRQRKDRTRSQSRCGASATYGAPHAKPGSFYRIAATWIHLWVV